MAAPAETPLAASDLDGAWSALASGDPLTVVKLAPDGSEAARYDGTVIAPQDAEGWIVVRARWAYRRVDVGGLSFLPGDVLDEWFSPRHGFNAFAVCSADGAFRGWYANVTHPARLDLTPSPATLAWHDLYLDVVVLADGAAAVHDEDELAASGLGRQEPALHRRIVRTRDEILRRLERRLPPFAGSPPCAPWRTS